MKKIEEYIDKYLNRFTGEFLRLILYVAIGYAWAVHAYGVLK